MSAATVTHAPAPGRPPGATSLSASGSHHHRLGDTLRAIRVFAGAAFDVIILGEYGEEAGVRRS
ncbi:hypothetical protein OG739_16795 [Streptomyces longwoodensis]|uniref:hypothetical protein n=1 Tax=Streptomyces longwoodensis TaxID=68231 RepID=UPI00224EE818|nr:hypothetical protein [Streptomyces longwoodensis]MCX4994418.1 hypothetical protein [Streptomyces longwoodensis]WRY89271.1 hypothetical protein OG481_12375 [Streptomyces longwoodensis]WTI46472.1 hypothetical protein OG547_19155 [Streptomyces longwoodensis]WUC59238.1 hypothetical protein OHA09_20170 [Streptomyces longwoodensis]WUC72754.1 hypothetical protein OG416_19105 [Streptomyces longwoodensis]